MTRAGLQALLSYWRRNPLQLVTLLAGLALATALWSGVQAINSEARASYDAAAATLGEGRFAQLTAEQGTIPMERMVALRRAGWLVSPVFEGRINDVRVVGIDPLTAPGALGPVEMREGTEVGAFLGGAGQVFGLPAALEALGEVAPEKVPAPEVAPGTVITDISVARSLLGREEASRLLLSPEQPLGRPQLREIAPELRLRPAQEGPEVARLTDSFHLNLTAFGMLSFAVGLFIVHGAIGLAFEQRRPMIRTLRALGLPVSRLVALLAAELGLLALVAGAVGVALGYLIAAALLPDVAATLRGLYGAQVSGQLGVRPVWWLSGMGMALGGAALAGGGALWRIARMPMLAAGQPRAWSMRARRTRLLQALAASGLFAVALGIGIYGTGLASGFALLAALNLGAALALPPLLSGLLALCARGSRGVVAQWVWADTRQQLPGLSLALMALLLAMAANVGVSTMVSSFRLTFEEFLDRRLAADLYVEVPDAARAEELRAFLEPRAQAVLPVASVERELAGRPGDMQVQRDDRMYRENRRFIASVPEVWDRLHAGEGVLINEQLARRADLWPGNPLGLGGGVRLPVLGVYSDYGNPKGEATVGEALFARLAPDAVPTRFALRTEHPETLRQALMQDFGLPREAIVDQSGLKAASMRIFERTFAVTGALNVLTLAVAGFAMLMSLLTLATMRLPQLAPVWALGLTRGRLGQLELGRAVLLAALTAALAVPLGLVLAKVLLSVVNVAAFGWRLPMFLFPFDYLRLALLSLVAAALAAFWPARRLARTPPSELLKVFANER